MSTPEPSEEYNTTQAVLDNEDPPYVSRSPQLPEGGKLDLGSKFVSRPSVVFHSHQSRTVLPGGQKPSTSGASGARPAFSRPAGGPTRPGSQPQRPGQPPRP